MDRIEKQGVLVIENVRGLPVSEGPYVSPYLVTVVCHRGYSRGEYDMRPVEFKAHDFSVVFPGHPITAFETSKDYRATLIVHSVKLYNELRSNLAYGNSYLFHTQPCFHLSDEHYLCIRDAIKLLKSVSALDFELRKETIVNVIDIISKLAGVFRQAEDKSVAPQSDTADNENRPLVSKFYDLLAMHYKEKREVLFYAEQLCLSPKYFGSLIKKEMGITAGQCIAHYVVIRAKLLLRYQRDLNIQQISHQLGFEDPASFSRYFKTVTGISPKQFREDLG